MSARKTERLVNLTILLLSSRRFVPREQIRSAVEGYRGLSDDAFERMFERDKEDLRAMNVPVATGTNDSLFGDEPGYRISRTDFELPPIDFTPDETTVLGLAATVWQQASAAEDTAHALAKLRAAGIETDAGRLTALAPRLGAREEAFEPLWQAVIDRQVVRFGYRTADELRTVEPWRLALRNNSWYLVGFCHDRQAPRVFKLARMVGLPSSIGKPHAFEPPDEQTVGQHTRMLTSMVVDLTAVLAIRGLRAPALRRRGVPADPPLPLPSGFQAYRVPFTSGYAAGEIAAYGPDVVVIEPDGLRADVARQLRAVLVTHGRTAEPAPLADGPDEEESP